MKMKRSAMGALAIVAAALSGCTTTTTTQTTETTKPIYTTDRKVYSKEELDKRGRQTVGESLAAQDPSITLTGQH